MQLSDSCECLGILQLCVTAMYANTDQPIVKPSWTDRSESIVGTAVLVYLATALQMFFDLVECRQLCAISKRLHAVLSKSVRRSTNPLNVVSSRPRARLSRLCRYFLACPDNISIRWRSSTSKQKPHCFLSTTYFHDSIHPPMSGSRSVCKIVYNLGYRFSIQDFTVPCICHVFTRFCYSKFRPPTSRTNWYGMSTIYSCAFLVSDNLCSKSSDRASFHNR